MSNSFATPWTVAHQAPLSMGILQARILGWVAKSFSRDSSQPGDQTQVSCIAGEFFTVWATREAELQMKREREKYIPNRGKKIPIEIRRGGLLRWLSGEESACQCRRHGLNSWVKKIPWRRKWLPTPALLPGTSSDWLSTLKYGCSHVHELWCQRGLGVNSESASYCRVNPGSFFTFLSLSFNTWK